MTERTFTIYQSSKKQIWFSILGLLLLLFSAFVLFIGNDRYMWIGVIGLIFFGLAELLIIRQLFAGEPLLILTPDALYDRSHGALGEEVVLPWSMILAITLDTKATKPLIILELDQTFMEENLRSVVQKIPDNTKKSQIEISLTQAKYLSCKEIDEKLQEYWMLYR